MDRARAFQEVELVPARDGSPFVVVRSPAVPEARQCDLFEWIEGRPLRRVGDPLPEDPTELATVFLELGRQAGTIANVAESWARPDGFTRPAWDAEGMFGENAHLGDWRKLAGLSAERRQLFERLAERLVDDLAAFGRRPDRFGLCHGDFLPENLMVSDAGLRLIDFDDCGESWYLFDFATALFDLLGEPPFEACQVALRPTGHGQRVSRVLCYETVSETHWSAPCIEPGWKSPNRGSTPVLPTRAIGCAKHARRLALPVSMVQCFHGRVAAMVVRSPSAST